MARGARYQYQRGAATRSARRTEGSREEKRQKTVRPPTLGSTFARHRFPFLNDSFRFTDLTESTDPDYRRIIT
jgi:hypothetical protein